MQISSRIKKGISALSSNFKILLKHSPWHPGSCYIINLGESTNSFCLVPGKSPVKKKAFVFLLAQTLLLLQFIQAVKWEARDKFS